MRQVTELSNTSEALSQNFNLSGGGASEADIEVSLTQPIGIINPDGYERVNRVYWERGFSPCITGRDYKDPVKILIYEK